MANTYKVKVSLERTQRYSADYYVEADDANHAKSEALSLAHDEFGAEWDTINVQPRHVELASEDE